MAQDDTRSNLMNRIIERAWNDEAFKKELLTDSRGAIEREFGLRIPDGINVRVVEETPSDLCVVLPMNPIAAKTRDLSNEELDQIAGGTSWVCSTGACGDCGS